MFRVTFRRQRERTSNEDQQDVRKCALRLDRRDDVAFDNAPAPAVPKGPYPPAPPGGKEVATDQSPEMLDVPDFAKSSITAKYTIAKTPPTIDFMYYPGQNHIGNPWSDWGDGCAWDGKYYSAIGDHKWEAYVYEYDAAAKKLKIIGDVKKSLGLPEGEYTPGKIHAMVTRGKDGWVYYSTHRGSESYTSDKPGKRGAAAGREKYQYKGDWVLKTDPASGETKVVAHGPIPFEAIPAGRLDPDRMIYYGGTADGIVFFALDVKTGKVLAKSQPKEGMYRYGFISKTTGKFYYQSRTVGAGAARSASKKGGLATGSGAPGDLWSYDPAANKIARLPGAEIGLRTATDETPQGIVWTLDAVGWLYKFDCKTEKATPVGANLSLGLRDCYHTTMDASPDGRYLYTVGGGHGGIPSVGTPVMQYDTRTGTLKVLCFLNPYYTKKYNYIPDGSCGSAVSPDGSTLYVTVNGCLPRTPNTFTGKGESGASAWYACALLAIHIPESERRP